jgi:anti-anti-sigma regulatory factor
MPSQPLIRVQIHGPKVCCEFQDHQLTLRKDTQRIFRYLNKCVSEKKGLDLILDFTNVNHISSDFIGQLHELRKLVIRQHGSVILDQVNNQVFEVLILTRTNRHFLIHRKKAVKERSSSLQTQTQSSMATRFKSMVNPMNWTEVFLLDRNK